MAVVLPVLACLQMIAMKPTTLMWATMRRSPLVYGRLVSAAMRQTGREGRLLAKRRDLASKLVRPNLVADLQATWETEIPDGRQGTSPFCPPSPVSHQKFFRTGTCAQSPSGRLPFVGNRLSVNGHMISWEGGHTRGCCRQHRRELGRRGRRHRLDIDGP
jgi:hypothetical protein